MNRLQIVQRVKRESGRSTGPTPSPASFAAATVQDLRIFDAVDDAWSELQRSSTPWRWRRRQAPLADLALGQKAYGAADFGLTDFWRFKRRAKYYAPSIIPAGGAEDFLEWLDYDAFRAYYMTGNMVDSLPMHWSISPAEELLVGPAPVAACQLRFDYYKAATILDADDKSPDMPADYHVVLVWRALMDVAASDGAPEVYTRAMNNYSRVLGDLQRNEGEDNGLELGSLA